MKDKLPVGGERKYDVMGVALVLAVVVIFGVALAVAAFKAAG